MSALREKTREYYDRLKKCRTFADFKATGLDDPLCAEYYWHADADWGRCAGCPIRRITGEPECRGTVAVLMFKRIEQMRDYGVELSAPLEEVETMANLAEMAFDFVERGEL